MLKEAIVFRTVGKDKHIFTTVAYKDRVTFAWLKKVVWQPASLRLIVQKMLKDKIQHHSQCM